MKPMKFSVLVFVLLAGLTLAYAAKQTYKVMCPECQFIQTIEAKKVRSTGGYSTNINGMPGNMTQYSGDFKCFKCKAKFTSAIKPDVFKPVTTAVAVPQPEPKK